MQAVPTKGAGSVYMGGLVLTWEARRCRGRGRSRGLWRPGWSPRPRSWCRRPERAWPRRRATASSASRRCCCCWSQAGRGGARWRSGCRRRAPWIGSERRACLVAALLLTREREEMRIEEKLCVGLGLKRCR
uniref:Uncharacterized protein n=1 Tax=Zea mays TaxID=4577 RepID=C4J132_MAIZE|nr:unknown [Zea mays]